jgi:haloalkane dehalogenase
VIGELGHEADYPFQHGFAATPHGRMHYAEAGQGDTVLCLHGNGTWSFLYRDLLRDLPDHRVIAPDLIGFGLSEKPRDPDAYSVEGHVQDVTALVESLDLRNVTLVVQDWGGPIGLGVALRAPERVRALVVLNTFGFGEGGRPRPPSLGLRALRLPIIGEQLVQGLGVLHHVGLEHEIAQPERRTERVLHAYRAVQARWYQRAGALAFPRLVPTDGADPAADLLRRSEVFLEKFRGPVLLVWGLRDAQYGREVLDEWKRRVPGASVVELPAAGHLVPEDDPALLLREVRSFLARADSPASAAAAPAGL